MGTSQDVVFLLDVDNTLLDNDEVERDLRQHLKEAFGAEGERRYWAIFEDRRTELGYADYLGALQQYRVEHERDPGLLGVSAFLVNYPYAARIYPGAFAAIKRLQQWGPVVILSDGDIVRQPRKVDGSGLFAAVDGNVLIYIHKEKMLDDVEERYPARHYVIVDDKVRVLAALKQIWGRRVTTVFPQQGHYAHDAELLAQYRPADVAVSSIGELADIERSALLGTVAPGRPDA